MSRPRSRSPHRRRLPWEERGFIPDKVIAQLEGNFPDRSRQYRENRKEQWDCISEDMYTEAGRRITPLKEDRKLGHQRRPDREELHYRTQSPHYDPPVYGGQRRYTIGNEERRREGPREHYQSFATKVRLSPLPLESIRGKFHPTQGSHSDPKHREAGMGWSWDQVGGEWRSRDINPGVTGEGQREAGREKRRRNISPTRDRRQEDLHQERSPSIKRHRREMGNTSHHGYRNVEDFGNQRYSVDSSRDRFGGDTRGDIFRPIVVEHDHGMVKNRNSPQWGNGDNRRDADLKPRRNPLPLMSLSLPLTSSDSHSEDGEDLRERFFQDTRRDSVNPVLNTSPVLDDKCNAMKHDNDDRSVTRKWRDGPHPTRGRFNPAQKEKPIVYRNQPRPVQSGEGFQSHPHEEHQPGYREFRESAHYKPKKEEHGHMEGNWTRERTNKLDRLQGIDLDPKMPRARQEKRANNTASAIEETLTIKVDMTRPVNENSLLCYSSDRQLSLDLVNVGRQRLDFLPMLETSGTYKEKTVHTGTFAQEIITLVHHVKEHYFRGDSITLNERFSAPQEGGLSEEEMMELTLDQRFTSHRGFSLNLNSPLVANESQFSGQGSVQDFNQQPVRGPGDLRHDLERRRQERLEGVKVTIPGSSSTSQRPAGTTSIPGLKFVDNLSPVEDEGFSRAEGIMRKGVSHGQNTGFQSRNNRFSNRVGPMRRQNNHINNKGQHW